MTVATTDRSLWVCWRKPPELPDDQTPILTFLSAREQLALARERGATVDGRTPGPETRRRVRDLYLRLVADVGTARLSDGRTLRQALARPNQSSPWWYHPVAIRDSEEDSTFLHLLQIYVIAGLARELGLRRLVLYGSPHGVASALRSGFAVEERMLVSPARWRHRVRALGSRMKTAARTALQARAAGAVPTGSAAPIDVAFNGYWNWSVDTDAAGDIVDRYFTRVPAELRNRGVVSQCWLAWLDGQGRLRLPWAVLARSAATTGRVVLLQAFLHGWDIARAALDFRPLLVFSRLRRAEPFRTTFIRDGIDLYPLFDERLLLGFLGASLPLYELMSLAMERASRVVKPKVVLEFLEHFPAARARYEGLRRGHPAAIRCAVQHASYAHETTILALDAEREYHGQPDGCASPHADYACAMGTLGRDLFVEYGYPPERIIVTGSPRHERVGLVISRPKAEAGRLRVLIVAATAIEIEIEMLEAAYLAAEGLDGVSLTVRDHPLRAVTQHERFRTMSPRFELSTKSLDADLGGADLVLFTYSTVGEEAFLAGCRVVQWRPLAFDGSALAEVADISRCATVGALRRILLQHLEVSADVTPTPERLTEVRQKLFGPAVGSSAERLSDFASALIRTGVRPDVGLASPSSAAAAL